MKVHVTLELCERHADKLQRCGEEWLADQKRIAGAAGKITSAAAARRVVENARLRSPEGDVDEGWIHILMAFDCGGANPCSWTYKIEGDEVKP